MLLTYKLISIIMFIMKMEQIGKNFTTPGTNFNVDKQYDLDFDFANQLVDTLEKINKEFPGAKLTVEDISNYDGKHFMIVDRKKTFDEEEKKRRFGSECGKSHLDFNCRF